MNPKLRLKTVGDASWFLLAALLLTIFVPGQIGYAQEKTNSSNSKAAQKTTSETTTKLVPVQQDQIGLLEKASDGASRQGIKVHGHWTIDVRNPDGTLATHREFENAYAPNNVFLANALARSVSVGYWAIFLAPAAGLTGPCANLVCYIIEQADMPAAGFPNFHTLNVSSNNGTLVLSGTLQAQTTGTIYEVFTEPSGCPSSTAPSTPCITTGLTRQSDLTQAFLTPAIAVSQGQTVSVTVVISFS